MKEELYVEDGRMMKKVTLPSGATIITDVTIPVIDPEAPPPPISTYQLLIRIADKLGVDTTP